MAACSHLDVIHVVEPSEPVAGCAACLAAGDSWVHLRMCMTCGEVGCCDSSRGRHASKHAAAAGHPILRSVEPGEDWCWCAIDDAYFRVASLA